MTTYWNVVTAVGTVMATRAAAGGIWVATSIAKKDRREAIARELRDRQVWAAQKRLESALVDVELHGILHTRCLQRARQGRHRQGRVTRHHGGAVGTHPNPGAPYGCGVADGLAQPAVNVLLTEGAVAA